MCIRDRGRGSSTCCKVAVLRASVSVNICANCKDAAAQTGVDKVRHCDQSGDSLGSASVGLNRRTGFIFFSIFSSSLQKC